MMQVRMNRSPSDQTPLGKLRSKLSEQDDPQASARELFDNHLDGRGTKVLDKEGLRRIFEDLGIPASESEVEETFKMFDTDGSGDVSFEEFDNGLGVDKTKMLEWIQSTGLLAPLAKLLPPMSVSELPEYFSCLSEVSHARARTHREGTRMHRPPPAAPHGRKHTQTTT